MFRTVLVPLDGSPFAEQALPWALSIARQAGATLDLVRGHVLYALKTPASAWVPYDPEMEAECKQEEELYLDSTALWLTAVSPVPIHTAVVPGLEAGGILKRARAVQADLIVMTTHARGPLGRLFLGSMATEIVRRSAIPVLLIHSREPAPGLIPEPSPQRLLIPLDGSALAEQALGPATDLARLLEVPCCLMRAVGPLDGSLPHTTGPRGHTTRRGGIRGEQAFFDSSASATRFRHEGCLRSPAREEMVRSASRSEGG
jgi:nucleotide-binding universal stress UspA family protein